MNDFASNGMKVRFRGVRGSIPSPSPRTMRYGANTSCVEVRSGDQLLILDAGSGVRALGEELAASKEAIQATLLLSHAHWDHIQGLPFFAPGYAPQNRIEIFVAPGYGLRLQEALVNQMSRSHFPVGLEQMRGLTPVTELAAGANQIGNFSVRTIELNHPGGCAGFRLGIGGVSIAYLPDHEPYAEAGGHRERRAALVEFVYGVDLLILDTQYTEAEYRNRIGWGHGHLPQSVLLGLDANVRQLAFFHHDPAHSDEQVDEMVNDAAMMAGRSNLSVRAASENDLIELTPCPMNAFHAQIRPLPAVASPVVPAEIR